MDTVKGLIIIDMADPGHFKPTDWFEASVSSQPYSFLSAGLKFWGFLTRLRDRAYVLRIADPDRIERIRSSAAMISPIDEQTWDQVEAGECPVVRLDDVAKAVLALPGSKYWDEDWYKKR